MLVKRLELSAQRNRGLQSSGQPVRNSNGFNLLKDQGLGGECLKGMTIPHTGQVSDTTIKPQEKAWVEGVEGGGKEQFGGGRTQPPEPESTLLGSKLVSLWAGATCFKACCCDLSGFFSITVLPESLWHF